MTQLHEVLHKKEDRVNIALGEYDRLKECEKAVYDFKKLISKDSKYIIVKDYGDLSHDIFKRFMGKSNVELSYILPDEFVNYTLELIEPTLKRFKDQSEACIKNNANTPWYNKILKWR